MAAVDPLPTRRPKTQSIGNHGYRRKAHGKGRNEGAQEPACQGVQHSRRKRNPQGVVTEGEQQILVDVPHGGLAQLPGSNNSAQIALDQGDLRAFHGNVGSSPIAIPTSA